MTSEHRPARLRVGVVGAGRAGAVVGAAWHRVGHRVVAATAVSAPSQRRARALLPGVPLLPAPDVVATADLAVLAVPDVELAALVAGLAAVDAFHPGQIVVHLSPGSGIGVLEPAAASDVLPLALHPALAMTGVPSDVDRLVGAAVAVTTLRTLQALGEALVVEIGAEPVWIEEEDRAAYAASIGAVRDGMEAVLGAASRVLQDAGVARPAGVLAPLARSVLEGVTPRGTVSSDLPTSAAEDQEPA
ncbi:MAG: DUF2520 domain-containing protein [Dermatophilaceae bacterium]